MNNLMNLKYWFSIYPPYLSTSGIKIFAFILIAFLLFSLFLKIFIIKTKEKLHRRLYRKLLSFSLTNIFVFLYLFFLMYEKVPFLASRFWFLVWGIIVLIWLYFIFKFYRKIPSQKEERKKQEEFSKYVP